MKSPRRQQQIALLRRLFLIVTGFLRFAAIDNHRIRDSLVCRHRGRFRRVLSLEIPLSSVDIDAKLRVLKTLLA